MRKGSAESEALGPDWGCSQPDAKLHEEVYIPPEGSDGSQIEFESIIEEGSRSEGRLRERVAAGGFGVSLSGGGHRASLAGVGALLALVDRTLNRQVMQIASVSGGSITNAFIAMRCDFEKLERCGLDPIAADLVRSITQDGVLTRSWLIAIFGVPALLGGGVGYALALVGLPRWGAAVLGLAIGLGLLMFAGQVIERLLDRRYLRTPEPSKRSRRRSRARVGSLAGRSVEHVFCTTDLVLGLPVIVSSKHGGMVWRRLTVGSASVLGRALSQTFQAGPTLLAAIVRASAAFPGIPPRRFRMPEDPITSGFAGVPSVAYLADGGLWNNLGTHVLREDRFLGAHATLDHGVLRPYGQAPAMPLLAINGSGKLRPRRPGIFRVPGLGLIAGLLQGSRSLAANTVFPRIEAMRKSYERRTAGFHGRRPDDHDPVDLVVDLSEPAETLRAYGFTWGEEEIRQTDPAIERWERDVLGQVRSAREFATSTSSEEWLGRILKEPEPEGSYPVVGFASLDDDRSLWRSQAWLDAIEREAKGEVDAPTTLGRIDPHMARRIIARAYLNTFYVSLYLAPLQPDDIAALARLSERLDSICLVGSTG